MFSYTLPIRTIVAVEIMFSVSFCAVPAFMRVEPMSASGPTTRQIATSTSIVTSERGVQQIRPVFAPRCRASSSAATT